MSINFDDAFGIHPHTLNHRAVRSKVLASNLANIDTPGYKARDVEFKQVLDTQMGKQGVNTVKYRVPYQNTLDGNTVELSVEQANFAKNAMDFETSLMFMKMKADGLRYAIEGKR